MSDERILALLDQIERACQFASSDVEGIDLSKFLEDRRTQQAVAMNLVIIGEAVSRLEAQHADFVARFPETQWQKIRGMRSRIAHGYFELDLEIVFDTALKALPELTQQLPAMRAAASSSPRDKI